MTALRDPVPPGHGEAERYEPRPPTYVVQYVFPDGNPGIDSRWGLLSKAFERADRLREELRVGGGQFSVDVYDEDDPERGYLTEDDVDVWD